MTGAGAIAGGAFPGSGGGAFPGGAFTEKDFYLAEFRGRTLGFALSAGDASELGLLDAVLGDLERAGARALVLSRERALLEKLGSPGVVSTTDPRWSAAVWRALRTRPIPT